MYLYTTFVLTGYCFSELHAHSVPIVVYGLRLFIVVLQELQCLPNCSHVSIIRVMGAPSFVCLHLLVSEIANVLPEGV